MPPRPTVLLFDIDGTLLLTRGAGRRAFERAFAGVTGRGDACAALSFGGMTDRGIARAGLTAIGHQCEESAVERLFERYLEALAEELARTPRDTVLPGVRALLDALAPHSHLAIGLGTGNLRRGAEAKLRHAELWERFGFGGFGCDHEQRDELLRIGAARGAALLGCAPSACRVIVIGDTARDVIAARDIGAECVAVETGSVALDALRSAGPCTVFRDLTAPGLRERLLG